MSMPAMSPLVAPAAAAMAGGLPGQPGVPGGENGPRLDMKQMMSWVRHSKNGKLKV